MINSVYIKKVLTVHGLVEIKIKIPETFKRTKYGYL